MKNHHEWIIQTSDTLQHTRDAMEIIRWLPGSEKNRTQPYCTVANSCTVVEALAGHLPGGNKGARLSSLINFCFMREQIGAIHVVRSIHVSCQSQNSQSRTSSATMQDLSHLQGFQSVASSLQRTKTQIYLGQIGDEVM